MDGIFIIDKPKGYTSHDIVSKMRKILNIKKIGHAGTLDPMATGVLPILVGKGTKISKYMIEHDKQYEAVIQLGEKKDTGDSEGTTIEKKDVDFSNLKEKNILNVFNNMIGRKMQTPPIYSAIKIKGKKLYEYARQGEEIKIPKRQIEIYKLDLIKIDLENKIIKFSVSCSKGTYIRTLCEDIAQRLNTVGYMKELKRTMLGKFNIDQAISLDQVNKNNIITIEEFFKENKQIIIENNKMIHFLNGVKLTKNENDGIYRIYNTEMDFIGLGIVKNHLLKRDIILEELV